MARIRTIKPEFFGSEGLSGVSLEAHMLAAGLLCCADDEGYFNAHPKLVQASVFPIRELSASVPELLRELQSISYIDLGQTADGHHYGRIVTFNLHQRISHPTASKIKGLAVDWNVSRVPREDSGFFPETSGIFPEDSGIFPEDSGIFPEDSAESPEIFRPEGKGREGNKERKNSSCSEPCGSLRHQAVFVAVPLAGGEHYEITEDAVAEWSELYPGIDVAQQIRSAKGWLLANPTRRKTKSGIRTFINTWLAKEQNKGGKNGSDQARRGSSVERAERNHASWDQASSRP